MQGARTAAKVSSAIDSLNVGYLHENDCKEATHSNGDLFAHDYGKGWSKLRCHSETVGIKKRGSPKR